MNYLPPKLDGASARVVAPRSPLVHAWGSPPVVMRCGVPTPANYSEGSPQTVAVTGVTWFQQVERDDVRWTAIRDRANVELVIPKSYDAQGGFLVELGAALKRAGSG